MDNRPQWPKYVAFLGFVLLGGTIGYNCAGGPRGFSTLVAVGVLLGSAIGALLRAVVISARRRPQD